MRAVIIAAGNGTRLWPSTNKTPKTLLPLGNGTILSNIMSNLSAAGVDEFFIVIGFGGEKIREYLTENNSFGYKILFVENNEYHKGNGISVLAAKAALQNQEFILSMADHIVPFKAVKMVVESKAKQNLLLVDKRIDQIFDIDDATKVWIDDEKIIKIGKNIPEYNAIDCGIFRLNPRFFDAMSEQLKHDRDSISAAIEILIRNGDMNAVVMDSAARWIDIDTPQAYDYAQKMVL